MADTDLLEDVIFNILSRLHIKSLIRFTSVSKHWRLVILSDPKFAETQIKFSRQQKAHRHRLLVSTTMVGPPPNLLESLDLHAPSFGDESSVRKFNIPFLNSYDQIWLLGSCNGLVFVVVVDCQKFCVLNPSTGLSKELPGPGFPMTSQQAHYGVGYLPAADDYKVVVGLPEKGVVKVVMFSLRARVWKRIESPGYGGICVNAMGNSATVLNEALHWLDERDAIVAFDLEKEELRKMSLPYFLINDWTDGHIGVSGGGCLCLSRFSWKGSNFVCIDFWVMREYGVPDSWIQLFNLKLEYSEQMTSLSHVRQFLFMENSTVALVQVPDTGPYMERGLIRIDHKGGEEKHEVYKIVGDWFDMVGYEESLLWIGEETQN